MSKVTILKPKDIKTTIKNKKTGEIYENEEAANIPEEDIQRDVTVIMPSLDLLGEIKND
jgi:hypothetical protein